MENTKTAALFERVPAGEVSERRYERDETIFRQGDACGGLLLVRQGRVALQRVTDAGHLIVIHRAGAGELFGEASLFSEFYHCTAVAGEVTVLSEVNRSWLRRALDAQPGFSSLLCETLANQIQNSRKLVEVLSVRNAEERVFLAAANGMLRSDLKGFAAHIGLSHEAVYRALSSLARQGRLHKVSQGKYSLAADKPGKVEP
ncbi:MAG: Crp/Fnr family transcriptional regulator [Burkholderiaceae bacterium]